MMKHYLMNIYICASKAGFYQHIFHIPLQFFFLAVSCEKYEKLCNHIKKAFPFSRSNVHTFFVWKTQLGRKKAQLIIYLHFLFVSFTFSFLKHKNVCNWLRQLDHKKMSVVCVGCCRSEKIHSHFVSQERGKNLFYKFLSHEKGWKLFIICQKM